MVYVGENFVWVGQARVWVGHGLPGLIARTASAVRLCCECAQLIRSTTRASPLLPALPYSHQLQTANNATTTGHYLLADTQRQKNSHFWPVRLLHALSYGHFTVQYDVAYHRRQADKYVRLRGRTYIHTCRSYVNTIM